MIVTPKACAGIGAAVMRAVEEKAARCGFQRMEPGVYALNTPGLLFWVMQGFNCIERVKTTGYGRSILRLSKAIQDSPTQAT